ncbi:MAG: outer membrane protein assembly factor BamD, partial [Longimicrobiales bacterium]
MINRNAVSIAVLLLAVSAGVGPGLLRARMQEPVSAVATSPREQAPAPWARQDPADSLYRAAREALNHGSFREAATLFAQISSRYPRSQYAGDALYFEAFSRYRVGGDENLRQALAALALQSELHPRAATQG